MANTTRTTVVIATSPMCRTCGMYTEVDNTGTSRRDRVVAAVNSVPGVRVVEISAKTFNEHDIKAACDGYHPQLVTYIQWFPILVLFNDTFDDRSKPLHGVIYGSIRVGNELKPNITLSSYDGDVVKSWITDKLNSDKIFKSRSETAGSVVRTVKQSEGTAFHRVPKMQTSFDQIGRFDTCDTDDHLRGW